MYAHPTQQGREVKPVISLNRTRHGRSDRVESLL